MLIRRPLDGPWRLHLDEGGAWRDVPLHPPGTPLGTIAARPPTGGWSALEAGVPVAVPSVTDTRFPGYRGVSWWSTEVRLAAGARHVRLRFGAARLLAEVFWDRELIAYDLEGSTPFEVVVPEALCGAGLHALDVRITNPGGSEGWEDLRPLRWAGRILPSSQEWGGLWQPVELEAGAGERIADVWVRTRGESVLVDVAATGAVALTVRDPDGAAVAEAVCRSHARLPVPGARRYGPGRPARYTLEARLADADRREVPFGFRELDAVDGRLCLDGEPFFLRTAISWGRYSDGPVAAPEELAAEVASLEALGLNALSAHRSVSTPALQDALEARGLFLYQEPGGGPSLRDEAGDWHADPLALALFELRVRRLARRDRNRACLVWWNLANEDLALDEGDPGAPAHALLRALRAEDDSRLATWTSGWNATPLYRPWADEPTASFDFHTVTNWPSLWNPRAEAEVAAIAPPAPMVALSGESANLCGLGGLPDVAAAADGGPPGSAAHAARRWLGRLEADLAVADPDGRLGGAEAFCAASAAVHAEGVARLVAASRANPALDGLAVNGWHSHPAIGSMGMTRVDRHLAIDPAAVRAAQAPAALALLGVAPAPDVGTVQRVRLVLVDDTGAWDGDVRVRARVVQGGAVVWEGEAARGGREPAAAGGGRAAVPAPGDAPATGDGREAAGRRVREIATLSFPTPAAGRLRLEAAVGELRAGVDVLGVEAAPPPAGPPLAVADGAGVVAGRLAAHGVPVRPWHTGDGGPVLVADATTRVVHLLLAGPPRRSAYLVRPRPTVGGPVNLGDLRRLGLAGPDAAVRRVTGDWLGSWAFSRGADLLPALGPAGVWDWTRCEVVPELMLHGVAGEVLAGACSFPDGGIFSVGDPVVGGTVVLCRRGGHELLLVTLPLWEDSALARALLLDVAAWLRGARSRRAP